MDIRVQDEQGNVHVFPDEASPEMIARALNVKPPAASPDMPTISQHPDTASQYFQDVGNDLRYGTGATLPGRLAQKIMPHGMTAGKPEGVAEFMGGPVLGAAKLAEGAANVKEGKPLHGAAQMIQGGAQAAALPMAVLAPETTAMSLPRAAMGTGVAAGSQALGANQDVSTLLGAGAAAFGPQALKGAGNLALKPASSASDLFRFAFPRVSHAVDLANKVAGKFGGEAADTTPSPEVAPLKATTPQAALPEILKKGGIVDALKEAGVAAPAASLKPMTSVPAATLKPAPYMSFYGATNGESAALMQLTHTTINELRGMALQRGIKFSPSDTHLQLISKIHNDLTPQEIEAFDYAAQSRRSYRLQPDAAPQASAAGSGDSIVDLLNQSIQMAKGKK